MTSEVVNMPNQDPQGHSSASGDPAAERADTATAPPSRWERRLSKAASWLIGHLRSPRTRLGLVGVVLLLVAILGIISSVWTLPLVVAGIVMVAIAWVGSRLDGRFAVEWGEGGTQLEFRAQIKAPPAAAPGVHLHPLPSPSPQAPPRAAPARPQLDDGDVIEGEGHTVEIDVAELKTLIRAAEAKEATQGGDASRAPGPSGRRSAA